MKIICFSFFWRITFHTFILINFLVQTLKYFKKKMPQKGEHYIPPQKLKKVPQKTLAAQMAQTEEFMFQNVA